MKILVGILICLIYTSQIAYSDTEEDPVDTSKIKHLEISNLNGRLDKHTSKLFENIETLKLTNCTLKPMDQDFLIPLKNLWKVTVENSFLEREISDIRTCCQKLKVFILINSGLSGIRWNQIGEWPLDEVYFSREKITELPSHMFPASKMKRLRIDNSNVEKINDDAFSRMKNLEILSLQNNRIRSITKNMFHSMKNIKEIYLQHNLLESLSTDQFPVMPNLEKLNIAHNPIKSLNLTGLMALTPKLKEVDISGIDLPIEELGGGINFVKKSVL